MSGSNHFTKTKHLHGDIVFEKLTEADANDYYKMYCDPHITEYFDQNPFLPNETPVGFTIRIISLSEFIFIIRASENPGHIIGDCALHNWDKMKNEIEIGGALYKDYWGKGIMRSAFELLTDIAKQELGIKTLIGITDGRNKNSIRLMEKLDFKKHCTVGNDIVLRKEL